MKFPCYLSKGDYIAITAPSDGNHDSIDYLRLERAKSILQSKGYFSIETENVRTSEKGRSSSAKSRGKQFMKAWMNPDVKAVFSAKGGDFLMEMLPYINWNEIRENPKWFQGYSDNTSLSFLITTICEVASVYCNNFNDFAMEEWHRSVQNNWDILCGKSVVQRSYDFYQSEFYKGETGSEGYLLSEGVQWKSLGNLEDTQIHGRLLGGCLDVLLNLVGTKFDCVNNFLEKYADDGVIWYLETFSLSSEELERGLWQLGQAGWFDTAKGFVFGRPTFFSTTTDTTFSQALENTLKCYRVPVLYDADIGHRPPQFTMINGAISNITFSKGEASMSMEFIN